MNKKIASEFAVGVIVLIAIVVAGISWLSSVKLTRELDRSDAQVPVQISKPQQPAINPDKPDQTVAPVDDTQASNDCKPHYYEGKDQVSAWYVSESDGAIIMAIKKDEISKLPVTVTQTGGDTGNFNVKLIDPTDAVKTKLKASSAQKPATITVQGYAEVCQQPPLVSIEKATIAFKNKS